MTTSHLRRVASVSVVALFIGIGASAPLAEAQESEHLTELRAQAEAGDADAQFNLGLFSEDYAETAKWYRLAAEQGHASAQYLLGLMYSDGVGVPEDYAEAVKWYRLAAEQGIAAAQFNLGVMYYNGEGVPEDDAEAYLWFNLAATYADASNRDKFVASRDRAAARLTPEQRADAQRRAREFFEAHPPD